MVFHINRFIYTNTQDSVHPYKQVIWNPSHPPVHWPTIQPLTYYIQKIYFRRYLARSSLHTSCEDSAETCNFLPFCYSEFTDSITLQETSTTTSIHCNFSISFLLAPPMRGTHPTHFYWSSSMRLKRTLQRKRSQPNKLGPPEQASTQSSSTQATTWAHVANYTCHFLLLPSPLLEGTTIIQLAMHDLQHAVS